MAQSYIDLELQQPELIDVQNWVRTNWSEANVFTEKRVKVIQSLIDNIPKKEDQPIRDEIAYLQQSLKFVQNFSEATQKFVDQERENERRFTEDLEARRKEMEVANGDLNQIQQSVATIEERIRAAEATLETLGQKKRTLVDGLNPQELDKIKFRDHLDESNDIFKWVLQIVYKESKMNYSWKNFREQAFGRDKGQDFLARCRGLALNKLKKDDFHFSKQILEKKDAYIGDLEPKSRRNESLRVLFDYISTISEVGDIVAQIESDKILLDERKKQAEHKGIEVQRIQYWLTVLEGKLKASQYYISTLERLSPLFIRISASTQDRLNVQNQYLKSLGGDVNNQDRLISRSPTRKGEQYSEKNSFNAAYESQTQQQRETNQAAPVEEEEEGFGGDQLSDAGRGKKVESKYPVPATDLKESEFAQNKKGSCESCNIF